MFLELSDAAIGYRRGEPVVEKLDLGVGEGELLSLLGPSGCGKTTTLRAMAGFVGLQRGRLAIAGRDYTHVPPNKRNIGMVFQSYALFPHLSVFENVAFGLRLRRIAKTDIARRVGSALTMVGLSGLDERLPAQLSGGQQQRVAMARAIVIEPQLLLLDEPLSNLDARLRVGLRAELKRVQRRLGVTMIYVTHDQEEALALSDRVVVMNAGNIEQIDTPEKLYRQPETLFVAHFMGFSNQLQGRVADILHDGLVSIELRDGPALLAQNGSHLQAGQPATVTFRPSSARLLSAPSKPAGQREFCLAGEVILRTFKGDTVNFLIRTDLGEFEVETSAEQGGWREEENVKLLLPKEACIAYETRPGGPG